MVGSVGMTGAEEGGGLEVLAVGLDAAMEPGRRDVDAGLLGEDVGFGLGARWAEEP